VKVYSVTEIADWFLSRASLSPKKLQKLVYYTQAWSNALLHRPIIETEFEAWAQGPVSPELDTKYHEFGWTRISQLGTRPIQLEDEQINDLLLSVWVTYQEQGANELEILARNELPWQVARIGVPDDENSHQIIDNQMMQKYYFSIYNGD